MSKTSSKKSGPDRHQSKSNGNGHGSNGRDDRERRDDDRHDSKHSSNSSKGKADDRGHSSKSSRHDDRQDNKHDNKHDKGRHSDDRGHSSQHSNKSGRHDDDDHHGKGKHHGRGHDHDNHGKGKHHGRGHDHDDHHNHKHDHGHHHGHHHGKGHHHSHGHHHGHQHPPQDDNAAPTANDDAATAQEDVILNVSGNVLANDTDPDAGDSKSVTAVNGAAGNVGIAVAGLYGTLTIDADGSYSYALMNASSAVQALGEGEQLTETFAYTMSDGEGAISSANLTITIDGSNDVPQVAAALSASAAEDDGVFTLDLLNGASDPDGGETATLSVQNVTGLVAGVTLAGTTLVVDPSDASFQHLAVGDSQIVTVNYEVVDIHGAATPQTAIIAITGTNDVPQVAAALSATVAEDDGVFTLDLLDGASDIDNGETATLSVQNVTGLVAGVTLAGTTLVVDPSDASFQHLAVGDSQIVTVNYEVVDIHGASVPQTATVTITGTNDAPQASGGLKVMTIEGAAKFTMNLLAGASDPDDGETATLSVQNVTGLVPGMTVIGATLTVNPTHAAFDSLAAGEKQSITVNYEVVDIHGAATPQIAIVAITGTNDVPQVAAALSATVAEDDGIFTLDLLDGASDPDNGETATLSVQNVTGLIGGTSMKVTDNTLVINTGHAAFQHLAAGEKQSITVNYDVVDIHGASVPQTAIVTITGSNDAPQVAAALLANAFEDFIAVFTVDLLAGASDIDDGETATLSVQNVTGLVAGVTLAGTTLTVDPSDASFQHLAVGDSQAITVNYDVVDIHGASVPQTATITIIGTNDAPQVTAAVSASALDTDPSFDVDLLAGASDVDDGETATLGVQNVNGLLAGMSLAGTTLTVDPASPWLPDIAAGESQDFTINYEVVDIHGAATPQSATVTITGAPEVYDIDLFIANDGRNAVVVNQGGAQGGIAGDFAATHLTDVTLNKVVAIGDADGDGDLDVFMSETGFLSAIQLLTNQGGAQGGTEGTFVKSTLGLTTDVADIALGDVDGDGDLDLLFVKSGTNTLLTNQGGAQGGTEGTFAGSTVEGSGFSNAIAFGDVDGDGDLDAVVANSGSNQLLTNQGVPAWLSEAEFVSSSLAGGTGSRDVALGDIDGDGDLDLLFVKSGTNTLLTNQGGAQGGTEGAFVATLLAGGSSDSWSIALGDVDNDGDFDALIANNGANQLLTNQGGAQGGTEGTFVVSTLDGGSVASNTLALADIDDDGDLDAVIGNNGTNQLLTNQGGAQGGTLGSFVATPLNGGIADSFDVAFGNLDGDGNVPAVDANGLPNINPDGLLPDPFVV